MGGNAPWWKGAFLFRNGDREGHPAAPPPTLASTHPLPHTHTRTRPYAHTHVFIHTPTHLHVRTPPLHPRPCPHASNTSTHSHIHIPTHPRALNPHAPERRVSCFWGVVARSLPPLHTRLQPPRRRPQGLSGVNGHEHSRGRRAEAGSKY